MVEMVFGDVFAITIEITDQDWENFKKSVGLPLDEAARDAIQELMNEYVIGATFIKEGMRPGKMRDALQKIIVSADRFLKKMSSLLYLDNDSCASGVSEGAPEDFDPCENRRELILQEIGRAAKQEFGRDIDVFSMMMDVDFLIACASKAVDRLPAEKKGVTGDPSFKDFLLGIYRVFKSAGGDGVNTSMSNNFLDEAKHLLARSIRYDPELARQVRHHNGLAKRLEDILAEMPSNS